jgi:uncharacterized cupredoxin-like copper-binding protein
MAEPRWIEYLPTAMLAGLALTLMPGAALAVDWSKAQNITVTTVEYAFKPADLTFRRGTVYRLRIDDKGKETHEFTAPAFFKAIEMRNPEIVNADRTEIVVQPGQHKDLYFTAQQTGSFDLRCADHDWAGMVGKITIAP